MSKIDWDLFPVFITGAEEPPEGTPVVTPEPVVEPGEPNSETDPEVELDPETGKPIDGRMKALRAERKIAAEATAATKAEKLRADALQAKLDEIEREKLSDIEKAQRDRDKANGKLSETEVKLQKLTLGYRTNALHAAIEAEAKKLFFHDPADALVGVDQTEITVTQDDDDPSDVKVDLKAVTAAVKKLATSKPHFVKQGTNDGNPTGSGFGGSRKTKAEIDSEADLRMRYPNL